MQNHNLTVTEYLVLKSKMKYVDIFPAVINKIICFGDQNRVSVAIRCRVTVTRVNLLGTLSRVLLRTHHY